MAQREKASNSKENSESKLEQLRKKLKPEQRDFLNETWQSYLKNEKWPLARALHSKQTKSAVRECLQGLDGIVRENQDSGNNRFYELTIFGVLLTDLGEKYFGLLVQYLEFLRLQYKNNPERLEFNDKDFREALKISSDEVQILGMLVMRGNLWGGGSWHREPRTWSIRVPSLVEDLPENGSLNQALEQILFRSFQDGLPMFIEDRQKQMQPTTRVPHFEDKQKLHEPNMPFKVDALKRRYQVFVSSTYEDLKEERQHVIQALLETKCIPLGMELFPAASIEQWDLIKRVIDECDYYLIVVAGRYGSLSKSGVGYTEMEYDYALSIGKPIVGFYHKDIGELTGKKLESTDEGKKRLEAFTKKVKSKLCRPWITAMELGSAVKSAILNELEHNPKPGWVRADNVPTSDVVDELKQKITNLEGKLKRRSGENVQVPAKGKETVQLEVTLAYDFSMDPRFLGPEKTGSKKRAITLTVTWDEILLMFSKDLENEADLEWITDSFKSAIKTRLNQIIPQSWLERHLDLAVLFPQLKVEILLKSLMAQNLITVRGFGSASRLWRFTPKGLQHLAKLQSL